MKNFAHQFSDAAKLRASLQTVTDLKGDRADPGDDEILGYELARRRIYKFRGGGSLRTNLAANAGNLVGTEGLTRLRARSAGRFWPWASWMTHWT